MNTNKSWIAAACASAALLMSGAPQAADSRTITVNATVAGNCKFNAGASALYRCTKGTSPAFVLSSGSTSSATGGSNDNTLSVNVSVNLANAANVTPNTYTDTIAITLTP